MLRLALAALLCGAAAIALSGCPDDSPATPDAGADSGPADAGAPFDLETGSWTIEQVSDTPGTASHSGALAFESDGVPWLAWSDTAPTSNTDQDIFVAKKGPAGWVAEHLTNDTLVQNTAPSMKGRGSVVHLAYNGYPDVDNDVFYTKHEGASWSSRIDLTSPAEGSVRRVDAKPSLALGPNGEIAVAFMSAEATAEGVLADSGQFEIRVVRIANGVPQPFEIAIPAPASGHCDAPSAVFDAAGKLHVAADCGPAFNEDIFLATDASGAWVATVMPNTALRDDTTPKLALARDGSTLNLAWVADLDCLSLPTSCTQVLFTRVVGGAFGAEVNVSQPGDLNDGWPEVVVDQHDRVVIAFSRLGANRAFDVFVAWSSDGATFSAPRDITLSADRNEELMPSDLVIDPVSGMPNVVFVRLYSGTNPLNSEIVRAVYSPP